MIGTIMFNPHLYTVRVSQLRFFFLGWLLIWLIIFYIFVFFFHFAFHVFTHLFWRFWLPCCFGVRLSMCLDFRWGFINACQAQQVWFLRKYENEKLRGTPECICKCFLYIDYQRSVFTFMIPNMRIDACVLFKIILFIYVHHRYLAITLFVICALPTSSTLSYLCIRASMKIYKCMSSSTSLISAETWE